jgi:DNA invertase Pin-like site-specific DNA recombinase
VTHPDRPRDKMVARIQGVFNQNYLEELSEKVKDALALMAERGHLVGPVPAGYIRRREINPTNSKVVRLRVEID